jgi:putative endonuclease
LPEWRESGKLAWRLLACTGMATTATLTLGEDGENLACVELKRRGYAILARRYRTRMGEIDIVARDGPSIVFVEVKTRVNAACGHPAEAVTPRKQRRIVTMATDFLTRGRLTSRPCRFDVVAITWPRGGSPAVEVIQDAFSVDT